MQVRTSVSIKFGFPNAGLDIRWGESFSLAASTLDNPWQWSLWWEVIVGNMAAVSRNVMLAWTVQGVRRTTFVSVPPRGYGLGGYLQYPNGQWGVRQVSQANEGLGEVGVWIPVGTYTFGNHGQCLVELPANGRNLSREIVLNAGGSFGSGEDQIGTEWEEVSRQTSSLEYGDATIDWPNRITMRLPSSSADGRTLDLQLASPLFPEMKDRLGAKFAETAVFTEVSRIEVEVELASGVKAQVMKEVTFRSADETVNLKLVFRDP